MKIYLIPIMAMFFAGCASTSTQIHRMSERTTLCNAGEDLGYVAVLPETAWRVNQKEPAKRERMALEEIQKAFEGFPCGKLSAPGGIRKFDKWSIKSEAELLKEFSKEGVDTIIIIRMEELTPLLYIAFSLPFLWGAANEADFSIKMLSVKTGDVLLDMHVKRITGGPFELRPSEWSRKELRTALHDIIGGLTPTR